jgi:hypothetical protein
MLTSPPKYSQRSTRKRSESGSRTEYLRRARERERVPQAVAVTVEQLRRLASMAQDLRDPDVMSGAWS